MSDVEELAREEPEAFRSVAEKVGGELGDRMLEILDDEQEGAA